MNYCFSELSIPYRWTKYKTTTAFILTLLAGGVFFPISGYAQGSQEKQYPPSATAPAPIPTQPLAPQNGALPAVSGTGQILPSATDNGEKGAVSGKPLPYFLSLRADEVNMRAGPGARYPISWTYHRRNMPVKVTREFDIWRLVEDVDGQKGWIQQAILSGGRSFIITGEPLSVGQEVADQSKDKDKKKSEHMDSRIVGYIADAQSVQPGKNSIIVRSEPKDSATAVAVLKPGVVGSIKSCPAGSEWCNIAIKGYNGWIPRNSFWGTTPQEVIEGH
ncbi:SH3-like domain (SH3) [Commensalibacter communis]|uniref:SH3 domain-containing protein n=1 Tax=Commensalibacter communis TaxID=2972786 RepID=UPI0022FF86FE|nr:SH3 domain-containing protein [Commensalibacter communis]CAI3943099.1 SH3-like domain (SH3) [Commensalibacter communis]CAI3944402.1 SH3-like domain (SH3) [Commensalibacter communis]